MAGCKLLVRSVGLSGEYLPSNLLDDLTNEFGALGKVTLATGDLGLGITGRELVVALVEPVGNACGPSALRNSTCRVYFAEFVIWWRERTGLLDCHCCCC